MRPLLSICIPTYNQPARFEKLLRNLAPQLTSEVEVVVRDDSTNDDTAAVVEKFPELNLRYFRGRKEGLDVAVVFLVREARGKYVWWLGDDTIEEGGVRKLAKILTDDPEISFVFVNSREENAPFGISFDEGPSRFWAGGKMVETFRDSLGFISATIFDREIACGGLEHAASFTGLAFVNLAIVFHVLAEPGKKYYVAEPLVIGGPRPQNKPSWYDGFDVFAVNLAVIARSFEGRFPPGTIRRMLALNFHKIWKGIVVARAKGYTHGLGSQTPKLPALFKLYWSFPEFWFAVPFLLLPRWLDRALYAMYTNHKAS